MKDWQLHNSRLFMRPGNNKHQSVYTEWQGPVLEAYKVAATAAEFLIVLCVLTAIVGIALAIAKVW
jgi:hypothetical protein